MGEGRGSVRTAGGQRSPAMSPLAAHGQAAELTTSPLVACSLETTGTEAGDPTASVWEMMLSPSAIGEPPPRPLAAGNRHIAGRQRSSVRAAAKTVLGCRETASAVGASLAQGHSCAALDPMHFTPHARPPAAPAGRPWCASEHGMRLWSRM
eukprot:scaffold10253_cov124-Isochrysis_galbana.AAC.30